MSLAAKQPMRDEAINRRFVLECSSAGHADAADGLMIALHGREADQNQVLPFASALGDYHVVAPRSARWAGLNAFGCFNWFSSMEPPVVEPIGFGDGLCQLELLMLERTDASERPCTLLGYDQGAVMSLMLAALWPERVKGIIAINGFWPRVHGWSLPDREMALPVLMINDRPAEDAATELRRRGARVTQAHAEVDWREHDVIVKNWLAQTALVEGWEAVPCDALA
ncbi:hypothetical protein Sj15T_11440 [Sphingobium sp. TA15]|uniref:Putative alpha/beta hydrolase n=1 Tax=Sphingobium indicum (strain DSM 16413 / CCM 7287 / MTCC 6362 / UT26 / NBRC 101211 / UT26S) TaxID=452662 RepID=D4Z255_SPHIU|nr:alpha/beta hydrolase [Sphingobium indicum]BAI96687.1 putative alpha/beta hydrolase [Sphingobium indicum UT26S]BDD66123.1 hypothetical protein Sj15T_11440 [Sphingobium sp. TA15]